LAAANAPVDVRQAPEALAAALLGAGLDRMPIVDDGATPRVHPEGRAWRARVEPVGFVAPGGVPVTLTLRLADVAVAAEGGAGAGARSEEPGQDGLSVTWSMKDSQGGDLSKMTEAERDQVLLGRGRLVKDRITGFTFRPVIDGRTAADVDQQCVRAAARIAEQGRAWAGVEPEAARLMQRYLAGIGKDKGLLGAWFSVDADGAMAPVLHRWSDERRREVDEPQPRLGFGAWPRP
jgi:hypothetical protein